MKKMILSEVFLIILILSMPISDCMGGALLSTEIGEEIFKVSLYYDYSTGKEFEAEGENLRFEFDSHRVLLRGEFVPHARFSVYGEIGAAQLTNLNPLNYEYHDIEYDWGQALGFGIDVNAFELDEIQSSVKFSARMLYFKNDGTLDVTERYNETDYNELSESYEETWNEVQLSALFCYNEIDNSHIYGGLFYNLFSTLDEKWKRTVNEYRDGSSTEIKSSGTLDCEGQNDFGAFGGVSYYFDYRWGVSAELRLFDETSFVVGCIFRI